MSPKRRICFVSGTRAEFGLMRTALQAIRRHSRLQLQIVLTGMHLDRRRGRTMEEIRAEGWPIDAVVAWPAGETPCATAVAMGRATARLAEMYAALKSDIVLVVGDRVEAFAAASAGHVSQIPVAHVHGGDRALGQVDDALRHAITKLAHIHFPATGETAMRIRRLGEDLWRIHRVGAPGIDNIKQEAAPWRTLRRHYPELKKQKFALVVLHPTTADADHEAKQARMVLKAVRDAGIDQVVLIAPNNDPGAEGILATWEQAGDAPGVVSISNAPRAQFLGLLRDAAALVGNSSSGIIEAASLGTWVINIGPRQKGRQRSGNVIDVPYVAGRVRQAVTSIWNGGRPRRFAGVNVYGGADTGRTIARVLAETQLTDRLRRKLIPY